MLFDYTFHEAAQSQARNYSGTAAAMMDLFAAQARMMGLKGAGDHYAAYGKVMSYGAKSYGKPSFELPTTRIGGETVDVNETILCRKPFGDLLHFERDTARHDPKVLLVAPMSGHYATLLRGTVNAFLPHHNVHITDWHNARDVPCTEGRFGLDEYVEYIKEFLHVLGPGTHVVAVCQAAVPVLAAISQMAENKDRNQPLSMTLMGAPIDPQANPTDVTRLADRYTVAEIERVAISCVPDDFKGAGRLVYPGYKQLDAFMSMNAVRHAMSPVKMYHHLVAGDPESAAKISDFYEEYRAVMDMTAEFFLETYEKVFKENALAKGEMTVLGQLVNPSHVRKTALLTVEGANDDISAPGQTIAAHKLCNNLSPKKKKQYLLPGTGHYGIFSGGRFEAQAMPVIAGFIRQQGVDNDLKYSEIPADSRLMPSNLAAKNGALTNPFPAP